MRTIERRLSALEARSTTEQARPWHQVLVDVGEPEDEAVAKYETEYGPIGGDNIMMIQIVDPQP